MVPTTQKILTTAITLALLTTALPPPTTPRDLNLTIPTSLLSQPLVGKPPNDFTCKSAHNPIITLHGLSASDIVDLNQLQYHLNDLGFCTFSLTYGAHTLAPWIGGLVSMVDSAKEIAGFVREVQSKTGAEKVDLVGHSEGGVMTLYVPLTQEGISDIVEHTVALGPAVHGARYYGFTDLFYVGGEATRMLASEVLSVLGCEACDDMATGGRVYEDFAGAGERIVKEGVKASIVMSRSDTLVTSDVSEVNETGVRNVFVQDYCPDDKVGHAGLAWDTGVWDIIVNELKEDYDGSVSCTEGLTF